jgi:DNA-binding transcriptional LysR family regulator
MSLTDTSSEPHRLNSELLRTFLAVAETGSMSAAAERILRSQSATSLQIKRLEELVGRSLFDRHGRGVALTETGEELRDVARDIISRLDQAFARLQPGQIAGTLRVGIPDEYGRTVLPEVLASFARQYPLVDVTARCALSAQFPEALDRGDLDIAVYDTKKPKRDETILVEQQLVWAVSRRQAPLYEATVPVVLYDKACWWREAALNALRKSKVAYRVAYTSESASSVEVIIEAGLAVGLVSQDRLRTEFTVFDRFPSGPQSYLVLAQRGDVDEALARPMRDAIIDAFR